MRFDANPSPSVHHPDTHIPGYGPAGMSSCIQIKMPCSRFMATDMNLKVHGAGAVRCARFYADVMTCNPDGACWAPWVHIYIRNTDKAHWVDIGDWDNPHNWGDWFQPWLDGNFVHHEDLTDENWNPRQVESVLICRDMSTVNDPSDGKDHDAAVGIDGVTVSGCCKPSP
jgi:hypothetical protein